MSFQLCNVEHPNSPTNTCVFCVFEATDNITNLNIALEQFRGQIDHLETQTWRGKNIRVFLSGDYEFLSNMYGLSGASGKRCLWCLVTSEELKSPPSSVGCRTVGNIVTDFSRFQAAGGDLKKAKEFNNCVCPPGLHITLGIFYRLFQLMEDECHKLDMAIVSEEESILRGGSSYSHFVEDSEKAKRMKDELDRLGEEIVHLNDLVALLVVFSDGEEEDPQLKNLCSDVQQKALNAKKLETEWTTINATLAKGFKKEDGPFVKALDNALANFNVRRQAYYSGTFVGNYVHRALKPENTEELCNAVVQAAGSYSPDVQLKAEKIRRTFSVAFTLFSKCHNVYDKCTITQEEIDSLGPHITAFLSHYKEQFPKATITPNSTC